MPILAIFDSPGPLTTQPITATVMFSTPGYCSRHTRHLGAQISLDVVGELLEECARGAPAARACDDQRRERAQAHGLQDFLRDDDFARAVAVRLGRQRNADRVADALLQQHAPARRWRRRCPSSPCPLRSGRDAADSRSGARVRCRRRSGPARPRPCTTRMMRSRRQAELFGALRAARCAETTSASRITASRVAADAARGRFRPSCAPADPGRGCPS